MMTGTFPRTCWQAPQLEAEVLRGVFEIPEGKVRSPLDRLSLQAAPVLWNCWACWLHRLTSSQEEHLYAQTPR